MYSELQNQKTEGDVLDNLLLEINDLLKRLSSLRSTTENEMEPFSENISSEPYSQEVFFDFQGLCS